MKRSMCFLLTTLLAVMLIGSLCVTVNAERYGDLTYTVSAGEATIVGFAEELVGDIVIPSTVDGYPVTTIGMSAFKNCEAITGVTIPEGVKIIKHYAFQNCTGLTRINIPASVTEIRASAFDRCEALADVYITDATAWCSIKFGNDTANPLSVNGKIHILDGAGEQVSHVILGETVIRIPDYAFRGCIGLKEITIPKYVSDIGEDAFLDCVDLKMITVDQNNTYFSSDAQGVLYDREKTSLIRAPQGIERCAVPDTVDEIEHHAFYGCAQLTDLTIPEGVTTIWWSAFQNCTGLTSVRIPDSVAAIYGSTFSGCTALSSVSIGTGVTEIATEAFRDCTALKTVTIPAGVKQIGEKAFSGCAGLTGFEVDAGSRFFSSDDQGVLYNQKKTVLWFAPESITQCVVPETVKTIENCAFFACKYLTDITLPEGITTIGDRAFEGCSSLSEIHLPESVTTIMSYMFSNCTALKSVTFSAGIQFIGGGMFANCTSLTDITIPEGIATIGGEAFKGCAALTSITVPKSVYMIGSNAFQDCTALTDVRLSGQLGFISNYMFQGCTSLTSIVLPSNIDTIGRNAFEYCTNLASVTIPACVAVVDQCAFHQCPSMKDVYYGGTETQRQQIVIQGLNHAFSNAAWHYEAYPADPTKPFTDVAENSYCFTPVLWALENKVTSGISTTEFAPDNPCTRGQVVTFLWRAKGCPEPTSTHNPFTDVSSSAFYYKAVLWAVEKGVTTGVSTTEFGPDLTCTRAQVVTFLYRTMDKPAVTKTEHPFVDVNAADYYYTPMLWAVENGITTGMSANTFVPSNPCTRGQVVTFLYRTMK